MLGHFTIKFQALWNEIQDLIDDKTLILYFTHDMSLEHEYVTININHENLMVVVTHPSHILMVLQC